MTRDLPELENVVNGNSDSVWIIDQGKLDGITQNIVRESIANEFKMANDGSGKARPRGGRNAGLHRQSLLWAPLARKSVNVAIIRSDGSLAASNQEKADTGG